MTANEMRQKYLDFFIKRGHQKITPASLIPDNNQTTLFISAGMQPLVPYLMGQPHPEGKRLVNSQKCLRTDDIDEVGDLVHHTFFEMLGNWSLGDYFKKESIGLSYEFLTSEEGLNLPKEKLAVSVFAGDQDAPFDSESYQIWQSLGIPEQRIAKLPKKDNWWGPIGQTGPTGPDSEMFIWTGQEPAPDIFDPNNKAWVEVWNNVFMEYNKTPQGKFEKLSQQNVDTGMGLERTLAVLNGLDDDYLTELFQPIITEVEKLTAKKYQDDPEKFRIITDHLKASVFLIIDRVRPSNKAQGYVLRRLLRRSSVKLYQLIGQIVKSHELNRVIAAILSIYNGVYGINQETDQKIITEVISDEIDRFNKTLNLGLKEIQKLDNISGKQAFDLYQTYGFPLELTTELLAEKGQSLNLEEFTAEFEKHKELSRTASAGMFKGGLVEQSEMTTKYHTATHLLHAALRQILGEHVQQKGSNITTERLRFDFSQPEKLTEEKLKQVEDLVNQKILENLEVSCVEMDKADALQSGALGFFAEKYGDKVTVYSIGTFSREICGGPHVKNTSELGHFQIQKEESAGSGIRRIYAVLT